MTLDSSRPSRGRLSGVSLLLTATVLSTGLGLAGCGGSSASSGPAVTAQPLDASIPMVVGLKSLQFKPSRATVKVGQRIDFTWNEGVAHNVIFDAKRKSKTVSRKGTVWSTTFDKEGKYSYKCNLHPGMNGDITVVK
jgi:plastocyanin